ncbi:MAG: DoxX family protein [Segetibacter sp.]
MRVFKKWVCLSTYFLFSGIAKTLGVIAILIPGYPRIKEWAYAGLVFDLLGATYSIIASGQPAGNWMFMAIPLILAACSYTWYHKKLKAGDFYKKNESEKQLNKELATA